MCIYVCVSVKSHLTSRAFVLNIMSRTQWATEVKKFVVFFSETTSLQRSSIEM